MEPFILRDYQQEAVDQAVSELAFGSSDIALSLPTAAGKSPIIAALSKELDQESIVIAVNITELIDQIAEHLDLFGIEHSILKAGRESEFKPECRVQLVMMQTLYSRLDKLDLACDIWIQDEVHKEHDTKRTTAILEKLQPHARIGTSATPYDANGFALKDTEIIDTVSVQDLQDKEFLSKVKYFIPRWAEAIDYSAVKSNGADYNISNLDETIASASHIKQAVESMNLMRAKEKKTIVFCSSIEQCEAMTLALRTDGYLVDQVHSKVKSSDNENIIDAFRDGTLYIAGAKSAENNASKNLFEGEDLHLGSEVKCLVSVSKLSTGFSVKDIHLGVLMRPTKVRSLFYQLVGRLTRIHPEKQFAELLDLAQCTSRFGFHTSHYTPLIRTGDKDKDKLTKIKSDDDTAINHLVDSLTDDLEEFDFDRYKLRIEKLEAKEKELADKAADITTWTMKELARAYDYTDDVSVVISIGSEIYTRKFGDPISKAGRPYKFNPDWISENIVEAMAKYPEKRRQWLKAYKTRARNIIKSEKNFNGLKFFADFLVENHERELERQEEYAAVHQTPDIDIDEDEIPF